MRLAGVRQSSGISRDSWLPAGALQRVRACEQRTGCEYKYGWSREVSCKREAVQWLLWAGFGRPYSLTRERRPNIHRPGEDLSWPPKTSTSLPGSLASRNYAEGGDQRQQRASGEVDQVAALRAAANK